MKIDKISTLTSDKEAKRLKEQIYFDSKQKSVNEEIYYSIDKINKAIAEKNQITFTYQKRVVNENKTVSFSERKHTVNPYALIWSNDHYYLVANNEKYDNLMNVRVDRISQVEILDQKVEKLRKDSDDPEKIRFAVGFYYEERGGDIRAAMREADTLMYEDKKAFYNRHPECRYR